MSADRTNKGPCGSTQALEVRHRWWCRQASRADPAESVGAGARVMAAGAQLAHETRREKYRFRKRGRTASRRCQERHPVGAGGIDPTFSSAGGWGRAWRMGRGAHGRAALEMREDLLDHHRVLDAGDDLHCATTPLTPLDVDLEHALEAARPAHGEVSVGFGSLLSAGGVRAAPGRSDLRAPTAMRGEHPMGQIGRTADLHSRRLPRRGSAQGCAA